MKLLKIFEDDLNRETLYWVLALLVVFNAGFLAIYFNCAALMAIIGYVVVMLMVIFFVTLMDDA